MTTSPARRLAAVPAKCALCPGPTPAISGPPITLRPASGEPRQVGLCELCHRNRPGRHGDELLGADRAWRVLHRDASDVLARYRSGTFHPNFVLIAFAGDIARLAWTENSLRAAARTAPEGVWNSGLVTLLDNAAVVLTVVRGDDQAFSPCAS